VFCPGDGDIESPEIVENGGRHRLLVLSFGPILGFGTRTHERNDDHRLVPTRQWYRNVQIILLNQFFSILFNSI